MKILVTGSCGFLGSHLVKRLLGEGHQVIGIDNLITGSEKNCPDDNPNFSFVFHDVINPIQVDGVEQIYHLACPASPPHYKRDPIHTAKTCFMGTLNMLEIAKMNNARILFTSTSEVYGDPLEHPQKETYWGNVNPIGERSCYDEGKRIAETLMTDYNRMYGTDTAIVRIFNTYGPGMNPHDGRVITNFLMQSLTSVPLTIHGDGKQTRSFQYVDDTMEGMVRMMNSNLNGPVNLGNPREYTIQQLANLIAPGHPKRTLPPTHDDPTKRKPDITLANQLLNWKPTISLEQGLNIMKKYYLTPNNNTKQ